MEQRTILFVGPPSSGKGTQSSLLAKAINCPRIDVGALLRDRARVSDPLGHTIATIMASGKTLADNKIRPIVEPAFLAAVADHKGLIIDGYCRSVDQVDHLYDLVESKKLPPVTVIHITVNETEATKRMHHRRYCSGCNAQQYLVTTTSDATACLRCGGHLIKRADDSVKVFMQRIRTFHAATVPAIRALSSLFTVITIDGEHSINTVHRSIMKAISRGTN